MTTKYIALPADLWSKAHENLDAAKDEAKANVATSGFDYAVFDIGLIGFYEKVSPIWHENPTEHSMTEREAFLTNNEIPRPKPGRKLSTNTDDDMPF